MKFTSRAELVYDSESEPENHYNDMNKRNYGTRLEETLLHNMPLGNISVIHIAPYHTVNASSHKGDVIIWLKNNILV
jgi:hypothetical protein